MGTDCWKACFFSSFLIDLKCVSLFLLCDICITFHHFGGGRGEMLAVVCHSPHAFATKVALRSVVSDLKHVCAAVPLLLFRSFC